jgi:hypothetical protein
MESHWLWFAVLDIVTCKTLPHLEDTQIVRLVSEGGRKAIVACLD